MLIAFFKGRKYRQAMVQRLSAVQSTEAVPDGGTVETIFTQAMFTIMGKLAKSDGRVSRNEIMYANTIMSLMGLNVEQSDAAINYFRHGKKRSTNVADIFTPLSRAIAKRSALANLFLQIQCRIAYVKGQMNVQEEKLLKQLSEALGFDRSDFERIRIQMKALVNEKNVNPKRKFRRTLNDAYDLLMVNPKDSNNSIKKSYIRLMNRYHPDKLDSSTAIPQELERATKKTADIKLAYESICQARKIANK